MQKIRKKIEQSRLQDQNKQTNVRTNVRKHESEFIGSFRSLKTSGEPKIMKTCSGVWKIQAKTLKNGYFGQKWPNSDHFRGQKFFDKKKISWSSKSYGDTTSCKKLEKNIEQSRLQDRNGRTNGRTDERTDERTRVNLQVPSGV